MLEVDGPKQAYFEDTWCDRYIYHSHFLKATSTGAVMELYEKWREEHEYPDKVLVWRQYPELKLEESTLKYTNEGIVEVTHPEPLWRMYFRCAFMPKERAQDMGWIS